MEDFCNWIKETAKGVAIGLLACLLISLLTGCKTKYVAVPEYHTRDSVRVVSTVDTLLRHDSVYVREFMKGDTVYVQKDRTRYVYKYVGHTDTAYVTMRDSVPCPVERKVTEYKWRTHWYDEVCRRFTVAVVIAIAIALLAWYVRKRK